MKRWLFRGAILAVLVGIAVVLRATVFRRDPVPVTVFLVARGRVEETVTNSKAGTVRTHHRAHLSPETGGRVAELEVSKGDRVKAGQVLIRLDDSQSVAQVANAERARDAAREAEKEACLGMELAGRDLARAEGLMRDRILSEAMLDEARSRRDVSRASCEAARARVRQLGTQVQVAEAELRKTVIRAPFDGVIADLAIERGEWITPSPPGVPIPSVIDLIDPDAIYVSAPLDEVDRGKVSVGQPVRISMDAYPGRSFPARIVRVAPYVNDVALESRTFEVEANFEDAALSRGLPPGASADVEVILQARESVLRIPTYAVIEGKRVLLLESACASGSRGLGGMLDRLGAADAGCLVAREVKTGIKNWEFVAVEEGLKEGERVVLSLDRAEVKDGARARQIAVAEK